MGYEIHETGMQAAIQLGKTLHFSHSGLVAMVYLVPTLVVEAAVSLCLLASISAFRTFNFFSSASRSFSVTYTVPYYNTMVALAMTKNLLAAVRKCRTYVATTLSVYMYLCTAIRFNP